MERLLADANELNAQQGIMTDYSIDSFADITEAIQVVQDNLGITGTTAEEAGTTLSGSWNSVKALFENIAAKVGMELAPTIQEFLNNVSEWMEKVDWDAFADSIGNALEEVFAWVQSIDYQSVFETVKNFVDTLVTKIPTMISTFKTLLPLITGLVTAFITMKTALAISSLISMVTKAWKTFKTAAQGAKTAQELLNAAQIANPALLVVSLIAGLVAALVTLWFTNEDFRNKVTAAWEKIKTVVATVVEKVKSVFQSVVDKVKSIWETLKSIFTTIKDTVTNIFNTIKNVVKVAIMFVASIISAAFDLLTLPWRFIWENFGDEITAAWEKIKETISKALDVIKGVIEKVWNGIKAFLEPILNAIKNVTTTVWNGISTAIKTILNAIKNVITNIWNGIKAFLEPILNGIKNTITTVWNGIKNTITTILNGIKSVFSTIWNAIVSVVSGPIDKVKGVISSGMDAAKNIVSNVLGGIKDKFSDIFGSAKDIVKNAIDKIKGFFNFSWSLPNLKLPHFSMKGSFSLNPPSVPKLSISWYKKAMNGGMILNDATIFGAADGNLLGAGEAGSEVVAGTRSLMGMIGKAVENSSGNDEEILMDLLELLRTYLPSCSNTKLVLDTGTLVGATVESMDNALGKLQAKRGRGR